jgi:glycosyltransferase involved in cell wall biosynthesis
MISKIINPSLSVVIPLYNKAGQIERALRSVFSQTYQPEKIIVVDDGSTDGSREVAHDLSLRHDMIIVSQVNSGAASARNKGVALSSSEYICFLDADDEWHPDHLLEILTLINNADSKPMLVSTRNCFKKGDAGQRTVYPPHLEIDQVINILKNYRYVVSSSSACVNRIEFLGIGGFPDGAVHGEDLYLWYRLALRGSAQFSPKVCAIIHNDATFRVSANRLKEVPYHMLFFTEKSRGRHELKRRSLQELLAQSAIRNSLGLSILKNPIVSMDYVRRSFFIKATSAIFIIAIIVTPFSFRKFLVKSIRKSKSRRYQ